MMQAANDEPFARHSKFRLEDFDTLEPGALTWRVKNLWPSVGVCFVAGPSMCGKSFWVLDSLAKVCRGERVLGRKSVKAGVVYIAAEGAHGVKNRIAGLRSRIGRLGSAFKFIGQAPDLRDLDDVADLRGVLLDAKSALARAGHNLGVVTVDTLSASMPGGDENTGKDMGPVLTALQAMAAELGALVLVITHTGKEESRGMRGWSGQLGNADGVIMLESPQGAIRGGEVVKVKDGPSGDQFAFSLDVVVIGQDADGDDITTCVIQPEDVPDRPKLGRKATVAQKNAETLKTAFNRIYETKAATIYAAGATGPSGEAVKGLRLADLRAEALVIGLGPAEPDYAGMNDRDRNAARKAWLGHRNKTFNRAVDELRAAGGYRIEHDWIWEVARGSGDAR